MLDHASTQAEVDEAELLYAVQTALIAAIRLQACKDWAEFAAAEAEQHNNGTGEQGTARSSDSPMTAPECSCWDDMPWAPHCRECQKPVTAEKCDWVCDWLRDEGALP